MHIVIFNGPPGSGKDTCAKYLNEMYGYSHLEMKGSIRKLAHAMASLATGSLEAAEELCNRMEFDCDPSDTKVRLKNTGVRPEFGNRTWRDFLIWISETVCKPIFGDNIFSLAAVKAIRDADSDKIAFSDCGFQIEIDSVHAHLHRTANIELVHLHREGCSFAGDSRNYVAYPSRNKISRPIFNNGDLHDLKISLDYLMKDQSYDV